MKKIFLTFLCILIAMQGIAAANSIYIDDVEAKPGDIVTLSIKMTNTEADKYCGFQFDVVLPEGISFVQDDGFYEVALSTERTTTNKTNFFDSALQGDGSLRILCNTSVNNSNVGHLYCFSGTSGEICTIKVKIDETLVTGEYSVKLQNVSMSDYTAKSISVENSTSKIKVKVDVPDVMKLYAGNVQARPGEKVTLSVQMDNDTPNSLCGFQFDVCLPEGVTFAKNGDIYNAALSTARTTVSKTNFFDSVIQSDGSLRILCNTTAKDNETGNLYCFSGKSGEVCTVEIELGHNVSIGKHYILLKNIAISDYSSVSHIVGDYTLELEVQPIEVSSVSLNKSSLTITEGDVEKLTATVIPANATDQSITWTTSDANVAKVDTEGNVTAVAEGTAIITATSGNGKTAQCAVIVSRKPNPVTAIALNKTTLKITEGDSETLTVTYTPADADDRSVTWTSSDTNIATVDANGKVTAVAEGPAIITATSVNGKTAQCVVVVARKPIPVTSISLNKTTLNIMEGDSETLTVTYTPADADDRSVTWTSSNGNVATVDANGKVTAIGVGTAIITATSANGKTAQCSVAVAKRPNPVTAITLNKTTLNITEGDSETLTVTYAPEDADDRSVTWTSSDTKIATVDASGKVTAVAEGTAIISATSVNGKTAQCAVVVSKKANPVTAITLNKTTLRLTEDENETLSVTYTPEDADGRSVSWTTSNGNVATVDAQGKVTAVAEGTAIITATSVNGKAAQCAVVVSRKANPVTAIALNKTTLRLTEGENEILTVTYTPENADGRSVTWTSSNGNVATVDAQGKVTAVVEGTAIITATSVNGKTAQCAVVVSKKANPVTAIALNKTTLRLSEGENEILTVTYTPENADGRSVTWTSSNGNVATVDAQGKVTAVAEGTAIITATSVNGKTAQCAVVVSRKANPVTAIALNKTTLRLTEGENETLSVTYTPEDADGRSVSWTTSDAKIATVDANGKVTAVTEGVVIVTATTTNEKIAQCVVIVENDTENISFADPNVKAVCVENWDTDGNGKLSYAEAAAVSSLSEVFRDNKDITSFEELQYFTGLTEICDNAFSECTELTSVVIPDNVTRIGEGAFWRARKLSSVNIPKNVKRIEFGAFRDCYSLNSIELPNGIESIDIWAFYGPRLNSITIPSSLVYLGNNRGYDRTFADCSCYMNSMVVEEGNPVFDSRNNCNAIIETYSNTLLFGCSNTVIPNDITSIGQYAFFDCKDMESIDLPDNLVSISGSAFSGCSGLRTVKIPDRVIAIGHEGFNNCHSLTSVTIPKGVTTIDKAFNNCENLTTVIEMREEPPVITGPDAFTNYANATLYVPYGCKAKYEEADYWKDFKEIVEMALSGDVNHDGSVTMADANAVVNYFLATEKPKAFDVESADVNGDGSITMADANQIVNMFLGGK